MGAASVMITSRSLEQASTYIAGKLWQGLDPGQSLLRVEQARAVLAREQLHLCHIHTAASVIAQAIHRCSPLLPSHWAGLAGMGSTGKLHDCTNPSGGPAPPRNTSRTSTSTTSRLEQGGLQLLGPQLTLCTVATPSS